MSRHATIWKLMLIIVSIVVVTVSVWVAPVSASGPGPNFKPNRVLIVSGIQMRDDYVIHDASDFGDITALLKLWGIPFDIMRLDTHAMSINDFIDTSGNAKYSVILWTARQDQYPWQAQDYNILSQAVNNYHISIIAFGDRIREFVIQGLIGLNFDGWTSISDPFQLSSSSQFVIRGLEGTSVPPSVAFSSGGPLVTVVDAGLTILATAASLPQLTIRTIDPTSWTKAVWIGGDPNNIYRSSPTFINLLKRSLVWTQGYAIYKDYGNSVVLRMDDVGSVQSAYFTDWHYPQLAQSVIHDNIILPLQQHNAKLDAMLLPGYPWIPTQSIIHSRTVNFTDPFGITQNIVSTYAGVMEGLNDGVIEVQSHGLTHMLPDLSTPIPGSTNWWNGTLSGEWAHPGWYQEFDDTRRGAQINATTQLSHLQQSSDWIYQDYGIRPLVFVPPGHLISGDNFIPSQIGHTDTITVTLTGAQNANFSYHSWWGTQPDGPWTDLGIINTDSNGNGQAIYTQFLGQPGSNLYLMINNESGTQFICGPITLSSNYNYSLRDGNAMTQQERLWWPDAYQTLQQGSVIGRNLSTYTPPHIATNYTYRLAGMTGYGLAMDTSSFYLGNDYVISLPMSVVNDNAGNFARGVPAVILFHDKDIADSPDYNYLSVLLDSIDEAYPGVNYLSMDEWSAYLHTQVSAVAPTAGTMQLAFNYDNYYSRYFNNYSSSWTLHLADETLQDLRNSGSMTVIIDGVITEYIDPLTYFVESQILTVPSGAGVHSITFTSQPTPIIVTPLTGSVLLNNVRLDWDTTTEVGIVGFNVYRSSSQDGTKSKLNADILPAQNTGQMIGASYYLNDTVEQGQHYYYWLELVMIDSNQMSDPFEILPNYWNILPTILR